MRPVLLSDTVHTDSFTAYNNNNNNRSILVDIMQHSK